MALSMNAQKCAVLEFKGSKSVSVSDVDGISEMFMTYFRPAGYTMVERAQIDKVISEQGFQRSDMTEAQMVRVGEILNVSKVVIGKISRLGGQYQVDVRVVDVESGHDVALDGATFSGDYRTNVHNLAQKLAGQIAIKSGGTVAPKPVQKTPSAKPAGPKTRDKVEVLYGYLKIFPNELGTFDAEPSSVIAQINKQAQHGYNNWRIPTNEELSLMRANGYLGNGEYMTRENRKGKVLLVSDGDDYATVQERERIAAEEAKRKAEEEARRIAELKAQGWVDLGLPSGTLWKDKNEEGGFYTYNQAMDKFGNSLPTKEQFEELKSFCRWTWRGNGYDVVGPNGNLIVLPAAGFSAWNVYDNNGGSIGTYWSSTPDGSEDSWRLWFNSSEVVMDGCYRPHGQSVRLVR